MTRVDSKVGVTERMVEGEVVRGVGTPEETWEGNRVRAYWHRSIVRRWNHYVDYPEQAPLWRFLVNAWLLYQELREQEKAKRRENERDG